MHIVYMAALIAGAWFLVSLAVGCVLGRCLRRAELLPVALPASPTRTRSAQYEQWAA
jgi:hypothetical protein